MNWVIPSLIIISIAFTMESLATGLGSGFLAAVGCLLNMAKNAPIINREE